MENPETTPRRFTPLCIAFAFAGATGAAVTTWLTLLPPTQERPGIMVSGERRTLGTCLSKALQQTPLLSGNPNTAGVNPPLVSVLTHPGSKASRLVYEGSTRLSFVVTLTETAPGKVETRLQAMPPLDPGPAVDRAVATCAKSAG